MIIVTGGAGFIGSNLVKGLNNIGIDDIFIVDNLKNGEKHKNMNRLKFRDYADKEDINFENLMKSYDVEVVFHEGACSNTMEPDGKYMMRNNYEYSKNLLNACLKNKARFIYASSASVYGNGDKGFKEEAICEYPLNVYAFSKYQFDRYVANMSATTKNQIVGLRYFNVYGPQENHKGKMASVAFHLFNQLKNGSKMKLFEGSENFKRDFIHVDDVVAVNLFFLQNREVSGTFNCGTGVAESFCKVAESLKELFPNAESEITPFPDTLKGKYQVFTQADMTKLRKAGYDKKFITVNEGTKKYAKVLKATGGYIV